MNTLISDAALAEFTRINPQFVGADWSDCLEQLLDTDSHLEITEPLMEEATAASPPRHPQSRRLIVDAITWEWALRHWKHLANPNPAPPPPLAMAAPRPEPVTAKAVPRPTPEPVKWINEATMRFAQAIHALDEMSHERKADALQALREEAVMMFAQLSNAAAMIAMSLEQVDA